MSTPLTQRLSDSLGLDVPNESWVIVRRGSRSLGLFVLSGAGCSTSGVREVLEYRSLPAVSVSGESVVSFSREVMECGHGERKPNWSH